MIPFPQTLHASVESPGVFTFAVEPDHPAFQGHFPNQPILPGVVQVDWAIRLGEATFGHLGPFKSLEHLKFQATIQPLEPLELRLSWSPEEHELGFAFEGLQGRKSSGFARFATTP